MFLPTWDRFYETSVYKQPYRWAAELREVAGSRGVALSAVDRWTERRRVKGGENKGPELGPAAWASGQVQY